MRVICIRGRNRHEARKKVLDFWFAHKDQFNCSMKDFLRKCSTDSTGRVIMFRE